MQKGITPVIAIILLLLITISMVGFAYVWFNRVLTSTTEKTSNQLNNQISSQGKTIKIDNIGDTTISIRNTGSETILSNDLTMYSNNVLLSVTDCVTSDLPLAPSAVATFNCASESFCPATGANAIIKVTAPGGQDSGSC